MSGNNSWQGGNSDEQPTQFQDFSQQGQQPSPGNNGGSMPQWGNQQPQGQGPQGSQPYAQPGQGQYGSQPGGNSGSSPQQFGNQGQQQYGGQPPYGQQQYGQSGQGQPSQGQYGSQPGQSQYGTPANQYGNPSTGNQVSLQQRMKKSDGSLNIAFASGIALAVAALFILIGSIGTWASVEMSFMGQSQKVSITGLGQVSDGGGSSDDVKDGVFTLIFAIGLIAMAALYLLGKLQKKVMWGAVVLAVLTVALSLYDVFDIKDEASDIPSEVGASVSIGWGLWLVLLFGLVALGASVYTALRDE